MKLIKLILRQAALDNLKMNCMFSLALLFSFFPLGLPEFINPGLFNLLRLLCYFCHPKLQVLCKVSVIFRSDTAYYKYLVFEEKQHNWCWPE